MQLVMHCREDSLIVFAQLQAFSRCCALNNSITYLSSCEGGRFSQSQSQLYKCYNFPVVVIMALVFDGHNHTSKVCYKCLSNGDPISQSSHKRTGINSASAARWSASVIKVCGHTHVEGFKWQLCKFQLHSKYQSLYKTLKYTLLGMCPLVMSPQSCDALLFNLDNNKQRALVNIKNCNLVLV